MFLLCHQWSKFLDECSQADEIFGEKSLWIESGFGRRVTGLKQPCPRRYRTVLSVSRSESFR